MGKNKPPRPVFAALMVLVTLVVFLACQEEGQPSPSPSINGPGISLEFNGPNVDPNSVYVAWLEDEDGTWLQNLYVCSRIAAGNLTGDALPYWATTKNPADADLDSVSGASIQGEAGLSVTRALSIGQTQRFRACFEIDRSRNSNAYFYDRPAFIYRSDVIDLSETQEGYPLSLYGWMSNDTEGTSYGQMPKDEAAVPGWSAYALMTDTAYIADGAGSLGDMVTSIKVVVSR